MSERFPSWRVAISLTSLLLLAFLRHSVSGADVGSYFVHAPDGSLVRSLGETSGAAAATLLPNGLSVQRQLDWSPGSAVLLDQEFTGQ